MNASTDTDSTDRLLQVLADRRRRRLLRYLADQGDRVVSTLELADAASTPTAGESDNFERTVTDLWHVHLPKLADAGFVEYDRQHGAVRYCASDRVETLLEELSAEFE